jgi:hypothetical protein
MLLQLMTRLIFSERHLHATINSMLGYTVTFMGHFNDTKFLKYKCFKQPACTVHISKGTDSKMHPLRTV